MAFRITCPSCQESLSVSREALGDDVRCPSCTHEFRVKMKSSPAKQSAETAVMDRERRPPKRKAYEDDDFDTPRRKSSKKDKTSSNAAIWWIAGGAGGGLALLTVLIVVILLVRRSPAPRQDVAQANNPPVQNAPVVPIAQVNNPPAKPVANPQPNPPANLPTVEPVPAGGLTGEQIYQRLLKSTVYIESKSVVKVNGPKFPIGQPKLPIGGGGGGLVGTVWEGNETLPGYGRLRFEFTSATNVTMVDAKDTSGGSWRQNGASITLDFGGGTQAGGCTYTGTVGPNSMSGTARNPQGAPWTWNVTRSGAKPGQLPPNPGGNTRISARAGTGVLIDPEMRLVVTNVHVVGPADNVELFFPTFDGAGDVRTNRNQYTQPIPGRVVSREPKVDLALVQINQLPPGVRPVGLASAKAKPGQQVHSVGNPGASKAMWIYSPGKVRQVYQDRWQIPDLDLGVINTYEAMKLETDSPINPGDSGGPLVNDRGQLVAIAHGQNLAANNLSYFIEVSEVRDLVQRFYQAQGRAWQPPREQ